MVQRQDLMAAMRRLMRVLLRSLLRLVLQVPLLHSMDKVDRHQVHQVHQVHLHQELELLRTVVVFQVLGPLQIQDYPVLEAQGVSMV